MSGMLFANCIPSERHNEGEKLKLLELVDVRKLTYEFMIQQSALDAANSATQALTVTYTAITNSSDEYR